MNLYPKKNRLVFGAAGITLFLILIIGILVWGPDPTSPFLFARNPVVFYTTFCGGVLVFLYLLWFATKQLCKPKPRVVLTEQSVTVNGFAGCFSAEWKEYSAYKVNQKNIFILLLKDVSDFISRQPEGRPKASARALSEQFESPFLIEVNSLNTDASLVENFIKEKIPKVR